MNRFFPALRGIAIILVVLNHTLHMGLRYPYTLGLVSSSGEQFLVYLLSGLGIFAVPIFLYLSGCFFSYAAKEDNLKANYKIVWVNLRNVLFPYLIWSAIFYLQVYFVHGQTCTPGECLKQLIVGYPFNFVPLMMFYYLLAPILIVLLRYMGWSLILIIGGLQLILLNIVSPGVLGFQFPGWMSIFAPPVLSSPLSEWAIFFPLGLLYVKYAPGYLPMVRKYRWVLVAIIIGLYGLALLDVLSLIAFPIARYICPIFFILLAPTFNRNSMPYVKTIESLGKRAYGLYLTNLIMLDLMTTLLHNLVPEIFSVYYFVLPVLFYLTIQIPIWVMQITERIRKPPIHRYVFG